MFVFDLRLLNCSGIFPHFLRIVLLPFHMLLLLVCIWIVVILCSQTNFVGIVKLVLNLCFFLLCLLRLTVSNLIEVLSISLLILQFTYHQPIHHVLILWSLLWSRERCSLIYCGAVVLWRCRLDGISVLLHLAGLIILFMNYLL